MRFRLLQLAVKTLSDANTQPSGFLANGYKIALAANLPHVRREVEAEYADQLAAASLSDERRIRREMDLLVKERLNKLAPPDALY